MKSVTDGNYTPEEVSTKLKSAKPYINDQAILDFIDFELEKRGR